MSGVVKSFTEGMEALLEELSVKLLLAHLFKLFPFNFFFLLVEVVDYLGFLREDSSY